jgi:uncharacterized protein
MKWRVTRHKLVRPRKPVMIIGLPGIGSVGKITTDMLAEQLKAKKAISFFSHSMPNSVFVKEDNSVDLPRIEVLHAKRKGKDYLFLVGDVQPVEEEASYSFTEAVLLVAKGFKCQEVIALGGIGLQDTPLNSQVYCVGNDPSLVKSFEGLGAKTKLFGIVGPIMGVTGLSLGLGRKYGLKCAALLAETYAGHMHLGIRETKGLIRILDRKYSLGIKIKDVEKDILKIEKALKPLIRQQELLEHKDYQSDTSYIG